MVMSKSIQDAHIDEQVESAIFEYLQEAMDRNESHSIYGAEDYIISRGWGYLPTEVFLGCYRRSLKFFCDSIVKLPEIQNPVC